MSVSFPRELKEAGLDRGEPGVAETAEPRVQPSTEQISEESSEWER